MSDIELSLTQLSNKIKSGELTSEKLCQTYVDRIQKINPQLNAVVNLRKDWQELASKKDKESNKKGRLYGIPFAVKDIFCTKDLKTTAASNILGEFSPPYTATCVEDLEKEGAIIIGKTNMDEFAMGSSNETSSYGDCKNPWDTTKVPGGSSGGSASAVAAGLTPASLGSDTGGSIRQPSSFCGIVGVKPTYGSISRYGMIAFASSLDQAGPMARSVEDCSLLLDIMIRKDDRDATNVPRQVGSLENLQATNLKGKKLGLPKQFFEFEINSEVKKNFDQIIELLKKEGAEIVEIDLPHTKYAVPVYYMVATSEASSNLARYDGVRYGIRETKGADGLPVSELKDFYSMTRSKGFGEEVQRRILLGTFALSSGYYDDYYIKACQVRRKIALDFKQAFAKCDWIVSPVAATTAFGLKEKISDPIAMYNNDIFTTSASLAGIPAMSLPTSLDSNKLPMGLQIMAPSFTEDKLLSMALTVEKLLNFKEVSRVW